MKVVTEKMSQKKKQVNGGGGDLKQLFKSAESSKTVNTAPAEDSGRNLLRLLSQNESQPRVEGITGINNAGEESEERTSASVQDFFAKAVVSKGEAPSAFTTVPTMFTQPPLPITAMPISQGLAQGMVPVGGFHVLGQQSAGAPAHAPAEPVINPVVQKLMSNPGIHSVDAIEAEQRRSASPQDQQVIFISLVVIVIQLISCCIRHR